MRIECCHTLLHDCWLIEIVVVEDANVLAPRLRKEAVHRRRKPNVPLVEERAAHLLYFIIKNHPFVDGNKRTGAYAFIWYLQKAKVLNIKKLTPEALTVVTLLVAESNPDHKDKLISVVVDLIS